jgi:hypothetical protein
MTEQPLTCPQCGAFQFIESGRAPQYVVRVIAYASGVSEMVEMPQLDTEDEWYECCGCGALYGSRLDLDRAQR